MVAVAAEVLPEAIMTDLAGISRQRSLERWLRDWFLDNVDLDDIEVDERTGDVSALFGDSDSDIEDDDEGQRRFVICNVYRLARDMLLSPAGAAT
jgi:hypothetical protein